MTHCAKVKFGEVHGPGGRLEGGGEAAGAEEEEEEVGNKAVCFTMCF